MNSSKEDILYFKDEILKDLKKIEIKMGQKFDSQSLNTKTKLDEYDIKFAAMTQKINNLASQIETNISLKEKVDEIYGFKTKIQQDIMVHEIKEETTARDLKNAINKYDAILLDSVLYTGVIGLGCKFSTFHDYIDFTLNTLNQLNLAKEKTVIDIKSMKKKYDNTLENLKTQIETNNKSIKEVNKKVLNVLEQRMKIIEEDNVKKFMDVKMDNNKYAVELLDKAEKLNESYKNMEKMKIEIEEKIKYEVNRVVNMPSEFNKKFSKIKDELDAIKIEFLELSEFVKNHKFETRGSENEDSKDGSKRHNNKDGNKMPKLQGVSILKQYISGKISYATYQQKLKMQNHHVKEEEIKNQDSGPNNPNNPNKIMYNKNEENGEIINQNIMMTNSNSNSNANIPEQKNNKKNYVMSLASEAEIVIKDSNNRSIQLNMNNDDYKIKNTDIKVNEIKNEIKNTKINSNNNELINNDDETIQRMIKIYNINHKKYKKVIEMKNKANNTSFQEPENSGEIDEKEYLKNRNNISNSSPPKLEDINEEEKNKNMKKKSNKSLDLEEKQYFPDVNFFGTGLIEVINYNPKKTREAKETKKGFLLEFIKKSYDDQEINDEKKLFQLKNAIEFSKSLKNISSNNVYNYSNDIFSNTLSHPFKKNVIKNIFKKETNLKKSGYNRYSQNLSNALTNDKRNSSNNLIALEKINLDSVTGRKIELDNIKSNYKKLNPIKLKGSNSSSNIRQRKANEADLFNKDDKKLDKLMNKIKDMIPFDEKISLFETSNIDNLNKNVFSKKKIYFEKKEEKEEKKNKDLVIKKLKTVYQNEPKNINNQINLINNDNFLH